LKILAIFILLIYWSVMILAPVMSKEFKFDKSPIILPKAKPSK